MSVVAFYTTKCRTGRSSWNSRKRSPKPKLSSFLLCTQTHWAHDCPNVMFLCASHFWHLCFASPAEGATAHDSSFYCNYDVPLDLTNALITSTNVFFFHIISVDVLATLLSFIVSACRIAAPPPRMMRLHGLLALSLIKQTWHSWDIAVWLRSKQRYHQFLSTAVPLRTLQLCRSLRMILTFSAQQMHWINYLVHNQVDPPIILARQIQNLTCPIGTTSFRQRNILRH